MAKSKTVLVRQTGSATRRPKVQGATLRGLGLGKIGRERELEYTLPVLGMIAKVSHLVEAREADGEAWSSEEVVARMKELRTTQKA